jgi:hypothetical protein
MSTRLTPAAQAALRSLKPAQLRALFAAVRGAEDAALIAAVHPPAPATAKRPADPLLAQVQSLLRPILAGAAEKAAYLDARMEAATGLIRPPGGGLAQAVRFWAKAAGPAMVEAEAQGLIEALAAVVAPAGPVAQLDRASAF